MLDETLQIWFSWIKQMEPYKCIAAKQTDPIFISGIIFTGICLCCREIVPINSQAAGKSACGFFCFQPKTVF